MAKLPDMNFSVKVSPVPFGTPTVRFEDVHIGDTISAERDGVTCTGVVHERLGNGWLTAEGGLLACVGEAIYLIARPKPKLPTEPGSIIIATELRGVMGRWPMALGHGGEWLSLGDDLDGYCWHDPKRITKWVPAEIREVKP